MTTALAIIQDALEMIGVASPGDTLSDADAERGLSVLNDMLDSWSNESLACYNILEQTGTFVVGQGSYTIGPGGNINTTRPLRVQDDAGSAYLLDQNSNRYPINVVDRKTWNLTTTAVVNSNLPNTLFYEPAFPLGIVHIWPVPNMSYAFYFDSYLQLVDFASLSALANFPPGYKLAITTNLAVALKPYFRDAELDPIVALRADRSLAAVKRTNMRTQIAVYDPEIIARGSSTYNIYRDSGVSG